jgi:hypothetical protein
LDEGKEHKPGMFHGLKHKGNLGALVVTSSQGAEWPQTMTGQPGELAGQPTIFADGALAPPMTSFTASKARTRCVVATKEHDMTVAGGASLNSGIVLAITAVDKALKGSMVGERMNKSFGREVRGRG